MKSFFLSVLVSLLIFSAFHGVADAAGPGKSSAPVPVITAVVETQDIFDKVEALGTLKARESVTLTASVTEKVSAIHFTDGQRVRAGDVLVEMSRDEETADLSAERATFTEAQRQVDRLKALADEGMASQAVLDARTRELETARARLRAIQSRMGDRVVKAPFDGVVGLRNISVGTVLQPGTVITTLDDDREMKLDFAVPSLFLQTLQTGTEVNARSASFPDRVFKGRIQGIDTQVDPATRSITARVVIDNPDGQLRPGLLMQVDILKNPRQGLMVKEEALTPIGRKNIAYVLQETEEGLKAFQREVVTGTRVPGFVEIVSGLAAGEIVVVHGGMRLSDGAKVRIRGQLRGDTTIADILKTSDEPKEKSGDPAKGRP